MSTKATVRALVRRTLEDTSISAPLWDDETLDDAIAGALIRYGAIVPLDVRSSVAVSSGANRIEIAGLESASWIAAVRDPAGRLIEPASPDEPFSGQGWRWWNGGIDLVRPAAAGDWTIDCPHSIPTRCRSAPGTMPPLPRSRPQICSAALPWKKRSGVAVEEMRCSRWRCGSTGRAKTWPGHAGGRRAWYARSGVRQCRWHSNRSTAEAAVAKRDRCNHDGPPCENLNRDSPPSNRTIGRSSPSRRLRVRWRS